MTERTHGFTLVELLVVVAIIALLVSILLPTLNKAKEQTRRVICASNLRNCGTNLQIYAAENNSHLPPHYDNDESYQSNIYVKVGEWDLREYLKPCFGDFGIWKCPALPMAAAIDDPANTRHACYGTYQYFPGRRWPQFAKEGTDQYNDPAPAPDRTDLAGATAGRVMMQDSFGDDWAVAGMMLFNHGQGRVINDWGDGSPSYACRLGPRGDGANLLFYDTHAEWVGDSALEPVGAILGSSSYSHVHVYSVLP